MRLLKEMGSRIDRRCVKLAIANFSFDVVTFLTKNTKYTLDYLQQHLPRHYEFLNRYEYNEDVSAALRTAHERMEGRKLPEEVVQKFMNTNREKEETPSLHSPKKTLAINLRRQDRSNPFSKLPQYLEDRIFEGFVPDYKDLFTLFDIGSNIFAIRKKITGRF